MNGVPKEALEALPREFVQRERVVPLRLDGESLVLGHDGRTSELDLRNIATVLRRPVLGELLDPATIDKLLYDLYGLGGRTMTGNGSGPAESHVLTRRTEVVQKGQDDTAIVGFVSDLLLQARADRATDIHLEPYEGHVAVRLRVDGFLRSMAVAAELFHSYPSVVSRLKVMAGLDIAEHRVPQDGRIKAAVEGEEFDLRVSILPTQYGESVNLRLLANRHDFTSMSALGLWDDEIRAVERMLTRTHGVILVSGPTGSGKTTSLYAFLHRLNDPGKKILTIEDPTEYNLPGISQIEIRPRVGLTFASGLRSMLRHDPDIMMVGEIRDPETAETVIRVALTGHLVLSTVHTNDAPSTPARLLDMGIEPFLLSSSLNGIIAQRLVRLTCRACAAPDTTAYSPQSLAIPEQLFEDAPRDFAQGAGCESCHHTGFRGRTAIYEILPLTVRLQDLIEARSPAQTMAQAALDTGFVPMRARGIQAAGRGLTTVQEVLRVTPECSSSLSP